MKIRKIDFLSVKIIFDDIQFVTDPLYTEEATGRFLTAKGDAILTTDPKFVGKLDILEGTDAGDKIEPKNKEKITEFNSPGDYEIGDVIVRRPIRKNYFILDEGDLRIMYLGPTVTELKPDEIKDLGDIDVVIAPAGGDAKQIDYEKLGKIISGVDPSYLVPVGCNDEGNLEGDFAEAKSIEEFISHFGYTHVEEETTLKVKKSKPVDSKIIEVIILK